MAVFALSSDLGNDDWEDSASDVEVDVTASWGSVGSSRRGFAFVISPTSRSEA